MLTLSVLHYCGAPPLLHSSAASCVPSVVSSISLLFVVHALIAFYYESFSRSFLRLLA